MIRPYRILPCLLAAAALLSLGACSQTPDPNARKAVTACAAVSAADASAILGLQLTANRMTADDAPRTICSYMDPKNVSYGLVQLEAVDKTKDQQAQLASDQKFQLGIYQSNVKPATAHAADGFAPGSFYLDITPGLNEYKVQLHTVVDDYSLMVSIDQPKDLASGEKQAAAMAKKMDDNIKSGAAFTTL